MEIQATLVQQTISSLDEFLPDVSKNSSWEEAKKFVEDNIKKLVAKYIRRQEGVEKQFELTFKDDSDPKLACYTETGWLKIRKEKEGISLYLRIPCPERNGSTKVTERKLVCVGEGRGSFWYAKPLRKYGMVKLNRKRMDEEVKKVQKLAGGRVGAISIVKKRKNGKFKALQAPWADFGDLWEVMYTETLTVLEKFQIAEDIAYTLSKMHEKGHAHLDMKPTNILVYNKKGGKRAYIGDMECAEKFSERAERSRTPTYEYCPPECFNVEWSVNEGIDLWALGLILLELLCGPEKNLFTEESIFSFSREKMNEPEHFEEIRREWKKRRNRIFTGELKGTIFDKLLSIEPTQQRVSAKEVYRAMREKKKELILQKSKEGATIVPK